MFLICY